MILAAIDPGVTTGLALWDTANRKLLLVESRTILQAMAFILEDAVIRGAGNGGLLVVWEDCRNHRVYMPGAQRNDGALQGVGSVKRDCGIWAEFFESTGIHNIARAPSARRTKLSADQFQARTGWTERSNNHGRDAAMLVAGITDTQARAWLAEAQQRQTRKAG